MNVLGIVAEYNPFHEGHFYHLNEARRIVKPDYTICILASNFLQRGEPSLVDKWSRSRMALEAGIDLVLELPTAFSCRSAFYYASGAVRSLVKTGLVTHLAFGSESNNITKLQQIAEVINNEEPVFKSVLHQLLDQGHSFPKARMLALEKTMNLQPGSLEKLDKPNTILALSYLQVLDILKSDIIPVGVLRKGDYHDLRSLDNPDKNCTKGFKSASALRELIKNKDSLWKKHVPDFTRKILEDEFKKGKGPIFLDDFEQNIISTIRRADPADLEEITEINEGLENRIYQSAQKHSDIHALLSEIKTKRYTYTRLQRSLTHIYLNYKRDPNFTEPSYLRILGLNTKGQALLSQMKTKSQLPLINRFASGFKLVDPLGKEMLELEARASDLYSLAFPNPEHRYGKQDFYTSPIRY